jgi:pimeloyl-ACP methyl ester carboxylesterase
MSQEENGCLRSRSTTITMNYEQQGTGEPVVLIPYLAADNACYAFQIADYAKHFTCISIDTRGAGETDKSAGTYSTQLFADDVAAFMQAIGIDRAHVSGLSLGAATGMWLAAKHPQKSLSLHSGWTKLVSILVEYLGSRLRPTQYEQPIHRLRINETATHPGR